MKTLLIDLDKDGVLDDDYARFFNARAKRVSRKLAAKIIVQEEPDNPEIYEDGEEDTE